MTMLDALLGGAQKPELDDFVHRYDDGAPWDGITDQEAVDRYQQVATQIPPDVYQESAHDAFARLTPEQRQQFGEFLLQQSDAGTVSLPGLRDPGAHARLQDPTQLAQLTTQLDQQQPGLLGQILGGLAGAGDLAGAFGGGDRRWGGSGGGGSWGETSSASTAQSPSGLGAILASPIAKAILAGIAAEAVKRLSQRR